MLDSLVILSDLRDASASYSINLVLFVGLDGLVMDSSLVLSHQNVILLSLLVEFDLRIQLVKVIVLGGLPFVYGTSFLTLDILNVLGDLISISSVVLPQQGLLLFLFAHLIPQCNRCLLLILHLALSLLVSSSLLLGFPLSHLTKHDFFISLGGFCDVALCLV